MQLAKLLRQFWGQVRAVHRWVHILFCCCVLAPCESGAAAPSVGKAWQGLLPAATGTNCANNYL